MTAFVDEAELGNALADTLASGPRALAVAYVGPAAPPALLSLLGPGDVLVCDASDLRLAAGSTSPRVLRHLIAAGVEVYSNEDLHAKVYVGKAQALTSSSNLSARAQGNLEAGALLSDKESVEAARAFVLGLKAHMRTQPVDSAFLDRADIIYRPPLTRGPSNRAPSKRLRIRTYGDRVPAGLIRFADRHTPDPEGTRNGLIDWSWGHSRAWQVGDVVMWVERDRRQPRETWPTLSPAVCDLKVPVGDDDRNWIYYWRYDTTEYLPWGQVVKSVAYHARGYELTVDSDVRRADVIDVITRMFAPADAGPADLAGLLRTLGAADVAVLAQRIEDQTYLDVDVQVNTDELYVALLTNDGALAESFGYETSSDLFWAGIDALEAACRVRDGYCDLGRQIWEVEGFPVSLVGPDDISVSLNDWPYARAAKASWTLSEWTSKRLNAHHPNLIPLVVGPDNSPLRGNTRLGTLRRMAHDELLLEPQFHAEGWMV